MEARRAGAGKPGLSAPRTGVREQDGLRSRQRDHGGRLEILLRVRPQGRGGPEVMLVIRGLFPMLVPMDQGLRMAGRRLPVLMVVLKGVQAQGQQLRRRGGGQEEQSYGERSAERHGAIVAHW